MSGRNAVLLDWFNVTYRSVVIVILAFIVVAGGAAYVYLTYSEAPSAEAEEAIARATALLKRAGEIEGDTRVEEIRENARQALNEARGAFAASDFGTARIAAIRSENLSQQAINIAKGDKDTRSVRFYRIEGDVRVKRAGEFAWGQANGRMALNVGDQVKTSSSASAQLIYFDGTLTTIQPGSLLEIRDLYEDPVTKVRRVREKLNWGELMASTQKKNVEGSYHEVATEGAAARSEEEGEFRVAYDKQDNKGSFDVFQGRIEVESAGRKESVTAGERIRANAQGQLTAKEILPGVPRLIAPSDQRVFVDEDPSTIHMTLTWEQVAGADRYRLEIANKALFTDLLYNAERRETSADIQGVAGGDYYWRVAAVSRAGVVGPFSKARRFRVSEQVIRNRRDTEPPGLTISELVSAGPMLIINGNTEPGASLWIDNEKVDVAEDGSFYAVVRLRTEGMNEIRFVAQDSAGNETTVTEPAFFEAY